MMWRLVFLMVVLLTVTACSTSDYNATVYSYQFNDELARKPLKQIMIAPINFTKPSRHYLKMHEVSVDESVKSYLNNSGYKVIPNKSFQSLWKKSQLEFGNTYNPTTGEITPAFKLALENTLSILFNQNPGLDAVVFTDLIETPLKYKNGAKRIAEWHGVLRKIKVEGLDDTLDEGFNWGQTVDGISISVYIFNRDQKMVQHSVGGIQIAQALKMSNNTGRFTRRNDLLINEDEINEGIALAFHPFILMKHYPGKISGHETAQNQKNQN